MKKDKLHEIIKEEIRQVLKEWFSNKEEFIFFEKLEKQQEQIYPDAADVGITPDHRDYDKIKPNILEMVKTFGSKNSKQEYGNGNKTGTAKVFIPIERSDYAQGKTDGYALEVTFVRDSKLRTAYRKEYDSFFTIFIERISISDSEAKQKYGAKSGTNENIKEDDYMSGLGMSDDQLGKIKDTSRDKFSVVEKEKNAMEYVVAYPDVNGIETEDGLYQWQMKDSANRELYFEKDRKTAEEMLDSVGNFGEGMIKEEDKYWMGSINDVDDFGKPIKDEFVDGKTTMGPWGIMSPESFRIHGVGVGQGKGQKYKKQPDGKWKKIQG